LKVSRSRSNSKELKPWINDFTCYCTSFIEEEEEDNDGYPEFIDIDSVKNVFDLICECSNLN